MKLLIMVFRERKHKVPTLQRQSAAFNVCQESAPHPAGLLCRDGGCCPTIDTCCHFWCPKLTQPSPWLADTTQGIGKAPDLLQQQLDALRHLGWQQLLLLEEWLHVHRGMDSLSLASLIHSHLKHLGSSQQCLQRVIAESNEQFIWFEIQENFWDE